MTQSGKYHGGLVFLGDNEGALDRFCRIITATLEDYGHAIERQTIINEHEARITSSQYIVKLTLQTPKSRQASRQSADVVTLSAHRAGTNSGNRLVIEMVPVCEQLDVRDLSELMLVVMLYRMVDICTSQRIEWLDPSVSLTIEQFLGAFASVSPRRVRNRQQIIENGGQRFAPIDDMAPGLAMRYDRINDHLAADCQVGLVSLTDEEALTLAFRNDAPTVESAARDDADEAPSDVRRLASWGLTGMVCFLSAPVALSLAAVNLVRGEDFRLNTQVLSLTGAIVVLQSTGALASVMSYIPV